ncbi:sulfatase-like hydrolase/transferase [Enterobacter cloacae]|uniref:sulfatase-like hydrolase/transferase n=1 Tax=Enterobacter cloacae TaxID=550 RepID=UPI0021D38A41|nr:sulfatase-like hydrolase/transferase [Enterobacter cloacae]MCU6304065.1 sulfatase-like hydrolase/transferase [Enterobacter cloacae]
MINYFILTFILLVTLCATEKRYLKLTVTNVIILLYGFWCVSDMFTGRGITESVYYHLSVTNTGVSLDELWPKIIISILYVLMILGLSAYVIYSRKTNKHIYVLKQENKIYLFSVVIALASPAMLNFYNSLSYFSYNDGSSVASEYSFLQKDIASKKYNYIFIYAESLERTFRNLDGINYLPGISKIAKNYLEFSNIKQIPGTGWTMAGIVNTQCAIPFVLSQGNGGANFDKFLPNAKCIGEWFQSQGYTTTFIRGSAKEFAGGDRFLEQHGWENQHDKQYFIENGLASEKQISGWGIHDDAMLDHAWSEFVELSQKEKPFILSFLTVNTHPPAGTILDECKGVIPAEISNEMLRSVVCSDYLLSTFINKVIQTKYFDNTIIVLVSDHLMMNSDASSELNKVADERRNDFIVIKKDVHPKIINTEGSLIDVWPTVLNVAGVKSAQLGFGRDLMSEENGSLAQRLSQNKSLDNYLGYAASLWDYPNIHDKMSFRDGQFLIGNKKYKMPLYGEVEPNGRLSSIWFEAFAKSSAEKAVNSKRFLYADYCSNTNVHLEGVCAFVISRDETIRFNINGDKVLSETLGKRTKLFRPGIIGVSADVYLHETGISNYQKYVNHGSLAAAN